jgi:hypothetical protein
MACSSPPTAPKSKQSAVRAPHRISGETRAKLKIYKLLCSWSCLGGVGRAPASSIAQHHVINEVEAFERRDFVSF